MIKGLCSICDRYRECKAAETMCLYMITAIVENCQYFSPIYIREGKTFTREDANGNTIYCYTEKYKIKESEDKL